MELLSSWAGDVAVSLGDAALECDKGVYSVYSSDELYICAYEE